MSNAGSEADSRASSRKLVQRMTYPPPAETALQNTTARNRLVSTATEAPNGRQRAAATISTPIAMPSKRAPTLSLKPTAGSQPLNPRPLGPRDRVSSQSQNPRSRFQTLLIGPKSPTQPLTPRSLTARR
ncbi:uncharacterized protein EI90DRAFT_3074209 [Cantharellus anzutake]|uniref:uncharacterized protein n=1 Tax=Cantharellus anzutake TaxID=1750568 RepID=UPI001907D9BC|nr:uncharacterized protein EI90DRAFT_3074209 [Cantharellus anzutake]KAF8324871.1 hypothetical protein EI90DRAFT_3074209 [Cantharellus anzutake]